MRRSPSSPAPGDIAGAVPLPRAGARELVGDRACRERRIPDHSEIDRPLRAERERLEVDLRDAGVVADEAAVAHRPHVQGAAERHDEVGVRDELGGDGRREAARDAERERVSLEEPVRDGRGREQRARDPAELSELAPRVTCTAAGDEHRSFRLPNEVGERAHRSV
jgi:hypothetical protein